MVLLSTTKFNSQNNKIINYTAFKADNIDIQQKDTQTVKENNLENNSKKILLLGAGLSVIAIAGILIAKKGKSTSKNASDGFIPHITPNSNPQNTTIANIENISTLIANFHKNISEQNLVSFDRELSQLNENKSYDLLLSSANRYNFEILKHSIAAEKAGIQKSPIQTPSVISLKVSNSESFKSFAKLLSAQLNSKYTAIKYTKGYMNEFLTILEQLSQKSNSVFQNDKTRTFLNIENSAQFIEDIINPENKENYSKLINLITNKQNSSKITILVNDSASEILNLSNSSEVNLNLLYNFQTDKFMSTLDAYNFAIKEKSLQKSRLLNEEISKLATKNNGTSIIFLNKLLLNEPTNNNIIITTGNKEAATKISNMISDNSNSYLDSLNCETLSIENVVKNLKEKRNESKDRFDRTELRTILHIENIDKLFEKNIDLSTSENKQLFALLQEDVSQHNIIPVYTVKTMNDTISRVFKNNHTIFLDTNLSEYYSRIGQTLEKEITNKLFKNLNYSDPDMAQKVVPLYISFLAQEKAGANINPELIPNLFFRGSTEATSEFLNALKNSLDVNYKKITLDETDPLKTLSKLIEIMKANEEQFHITKKRAVIEVENLDELFTDYNTPIKRQIIARYKTLAEHSTQDYHSNIFFSTNKSIEQFEPATLGGQRFKYIPLSK
jgi:hypothetical protein